jgi:hypothetical protein
VTSNALTFLDVHFYFICADKVQNLLRAFIEEDGDEELQGLWPDWAASLKPFNDGRNHLEHIDERALRDVGDMGNLAGRTYSFGGEYLDVSADSIAAITRAYERVIAGIDKRSLDW